MAKLRGLYAWEATDNNDKTHHTSARWIVLDYWLKIQASTTMATVFPQILGPRDPCPEINPSTGWTKGRRTQTRAKWTHNCYRSCLYSVHIFKCKLCSVWHERESAIEIVINNLVKFNTKLPTSTREECPARGKQPQTCLQHRSPLWLARSQICLLPVVCFVSRGDWRGLLWEGLTSRTFRLCFSTCCWFCIAD